MLLIRHVRPMGAAPADVLVQDGRIAALGPALHAAAGCAVEEGGGALLLPGLVEGHTHLDKTLWGMGWYRNEVGTRERAMLIGLRYIVASDGALLPEAVPE
jgi:cytosine deaminase